MNTRVGDQNLYDSKSSVKNSNEGNDLRSVVMLGILYLYYLMK